MSEIVLTGRECDYYLENVWKKLSYDNTFYIQKETNTEAWDKNPYVSGWMEIKVPNLPPVHV